MFVTMCAAGSAGPRVKFQPVKLKEVRAKLETLGFSVAWHRNDAWTLSRLERPVYEKMMDLLGDLSIYKLTALGVVSPMTLRLPSAETINLLGAKGIDRLLTCDRAMQELHSSRVFELNRGGAVDLQTTLTFIYQRFVVQGVK